MKTLLLLVSLFSQTAFAGTISFNSSPERSGEKLYDLPHQIIGALYDGGIQFNVSPRGTVYSLELRDLSCLITSNNAIDPDMPLMGVSSVTCDAQVSGKVVALTESRGLVNLLDKVEEAAEGKVYFTDCGMGKCYLAAKSLKCSVDTSIETFQDGRFSCEITDAMEE